MRRVASVAELPNVPAVHAMYGGRGRALHVAYVGETEKLKRRIIQHLVIRDSSITTGASAAQLNPDLVTGVHWWEHRVFRKRHVRQAAELVAFDVFDPALRSRGAFQERAKRLYENRAFKKRMCSLFRSKPAGQLTISTLLDLERRLAVLEAKLASKPKGG